MEALQTKGGFLLYLFYGRLKNSAKSVTVAQQERHLAQLEDFFGSMYLTQIAALFHAINTGILQ